MLSFLQIVKHLLFGILVVWILVHGEYTVQPIICFLLSFIEVFLFLRRKNILVTRLYKYDCYQWVVIFIFLIKEFVCKWYQLEAIFRECVESVSPSIQQHKPLFLQSVQAPHVVGLGCLLIPGRLFLGWVRVWGIGQAWLMFDIPVAVAPVKCTLGIFLWQVQASVLYPITSKI